MSREDWRLPKLNPFRVERLHSLAFRAPRFSLAELLGQFEVQQRRGCIVGPHGTGKTTLVGELCTEFTARGVQFNRLQLSASSQHNVTLVREWLSAARLEQILVLDGAEQLPIHQWWKFRWRTRHFAGLLITTHSPGRLPTLHRTGSTPALLQELVRELVPELEFSADVVDQLYRQHAGNIRECLRELYDRAASGSLT